MNSSDTPVPRLVAIDRRQLLLRTISTSLYFLFAMPPPLRKMRKSYTLLRGFWGAGLTYDALGRMVEQNRSGAYTQIAYSTTGFRIAILNGQSYTTAFVPLAGGVMGVWSTQGIYLRHPDWLGNSRLASNYNRTVYYDGAYAPFGEPYAQSGTTDLNFTGMDQDSVSGLYDFPAREYSIQGRWPSPDPAGLAAVDPSNPQSWNRYAYVLNNPLNAVDPLGLNDCPDDKSTCGDDPGTDTGAPGVDLFGGSPSGGDLSG